MPVRVVAENEVNLGGTFFKIIQAVQEIPQNIFPPKRVEGDYTRDSNPRLSSMTWSDFTGGQGLDIMEGNQTNRCWTTTSNIRFKRSTVLPELITDTAAATGSPGFVEIINEYNGEIYAAFDTKVHKYDNGGNSWGSSLQTLAADTGADSINITLENNEYLCIAYRTGYDYFDGNSWASSAKNVDLFADWDDRLWGISRSSGVATPAQLWYAFTPGTETDAAILPHSAGDPTQMLVYRDVTGESVLYVVARNGLYVYDAANDRFISTALTFPMAGSHSGTGKALVWRDTLYIAVNQTIFEIVVGGGGMIIRDVGPDRDDGLDRGFSTFFLSAMTASINELFVVLGSSISNNSYLLAWDRVGWRQVAGPEIGFPGDDVIYISDSYSKYRLWASSVENTVFFIDIADSLNNPQKDPSYTYAASSELKTPWFHADQVDVDKLAVRAKVETADTNSNETVTISYALDYNDDIYNQFDAIITNGVKVLDFSKWHSYLAFNGTSGLVTVSDDSSIQNQFDGGAGFSVRVWADSDGENNGGRIVDKGGVWRLNVSDETSGAVKIVFAYAFSTTTGNWKTTNPVMNIGELYRVGLDYDNGDVANNPTFYIYHEATKTLTTLTVGDGLTEDDAPVGTRTTDVGSDLIFGNQAADDRTFDGRIDDVRWYGATGEIAGEDMENELTGNEDNLIGYWKFDENTGSTANDSSDLNSNSGTISTATFAENTDKAGMSFKAIRFKIAEARGGTTTKSPRLVSLTLEHRKKLDYKQGFRVQLDLKETYKGKSPKDLRSALQSVLEAKSLVEFTYRNDTGETRNFWVDTFLQQGLEQTGYNERGTAVVDLLEA